MKIVITIQKTVFPLSRKDLVEFSVFGDEKSVLSHIRDAIKLAKSFDDQAGYFAPALAREIQGDKNLLNLRFTCQNGDWERLFNVNLVTFGNKSNFEIHRYDSPELLGRFIPTEKPVRTVEFVYDWTTTSDVSWRKIEVDYEDAEYIKGPDLSRDREYPLVS